MELKPHQSAEIIKAGHGIQVTEENVRKWIAEAAEKERPFILENAKSDAKIEIDKQLQGVQALYISVFGIFASIISFLAIEFQFLKTLVNINQLVGFTLIFASMLFGFNIGLDHLIQSRLDRDNTKINRPFFCMIASLFVIGIGFILYGNYVAK